MSLAEWDRSPAKHTRLSKFLTLHQDDLTNTQL